MNELKQNPKNKTEKRNGLLTGQARWCFLNQLSNKSCGDGVKKMKGMLFKKMKGMLLKKE